MHEDELRRRFQGALGEPPDGSGAVQRAAAILRTRPPHDARAGHSRAMALTAAGLTLLVLAGLLGIRAMRSSGAGTSPAAAPGPSPSVTAVVSPTPVDVNNCRLPMVIMDGHPLTGPAGVNTATNYAANSLEKDTAGFVALATGTFEADPSARPGSMPYSRMYVREVWQPEVYDATVQRWLPVPAFQVSPDKRSYAYVVYSPLATGKGSPPYDSSTLHVYDVAAGQDRTLWTYAGSILLTWTARGIEAQTTPPSGGTPSDWLVDPTTAAVTPLPAASVSIGPPLAFPDLRAYGVQGPGGSTGVDGLGRPILVEGTRDPGARYTYFIGGPNGQRIVIHSGVMGDAFDFDPNGFVADGDRLWTVNYDGTAVWLWTEKDGLKRFAIKGVPQHDMYVTPRMAGGCL